ncbi:hypothetical protein [Thermaurantiacus tibetensis]|nr:hypothetical protein [Thermaurantiacus tibetensis]
MDRFVDWLGRLAELPAGAAELLFGGVFLMALVGVRRCLGGGRRRHLS